jgi:hypothetical protein
MATTQALSSTGTARAAFLGFFPPARRRFAAHLFVFAVPSHATTPLEALVSVTWTLCHAQRCGARGDQRYAELDNVITQHPAEAFVFAAWALRYKQLRNRQEVVR